MKKILFATGNPTKAKRFSEGLLKKRIEVITLADIDVNIDVEESGNTAIENALIKARAYYEATGITTFAMDDTLYLENVPEEKQPGMYVRRVNGKRLSDDEMIEYYSGLAKDFGNGGKLIARWVYGMAVICEGKEATYTWNKNDFYLVDKPCEIRQDGYPLNTISKNIKLDKYFTDITAEDQILIAEDESHVVEFISNNV